LKYEVETTLESIHQKGRKNDADALDGAEDGMRVGVAAAAAANADLRRKIRTAHNVGYCYEDREVATV
jgi:hypothetical protein